MMGSLAQKVVLPFRISIASDKDWSKRADAVATDEIKVYTDGSMQGDAVGAAAILYRNGKITHSLCFHLGSTEHHTIYEAEMVGLLLGIHLIKTEKASWRKCALGADNQVALQALQSELNNPSHHIVAEVIKIANQIAKARGTKNYKLMVRWTAGHIGIPGNEKVDEEAKKAVGGDSLLL